MGGVTCTTEDVTPTELKTDIGTFVIWEKVVASTGVKVPLPLAAGEPPTTLTITSVATMTTTSPMASHVKSPAGRPLEVFTGLAGGRFPPLRPEACVAGRLAA